MIQTTIAIILSILLASFSITWSASAVQSPVGCNSNRLTLSITRDKLSVQNGDTLTYTVTLSNIDSGSSIACDIDSADVTVTLPALDGSPTGQVVTIASNASYPAGTAFGVVGTASYVVNVNSGVTDATAEASVAGVLHDAPTDHAANISKTIGTTVAWPTSSSSGGGSGITTAAASTSTASTSALPGMPNTAVGL